MSLLLHLGRYLGRVPRRWRDRFIEHCKAEPCIANERHINPIVRARHRRIHIDMDDLRFAWRGMTPAFGRDRAGAATDEDHEVGGVDDRASLRSSTIRTDYAHSQSMIFVD